MQFSASHSNLHISSPGSKRKSGTLYMLNSPRNTSNLICSPQPDCPITNLIINRHSEYEAKPQHLRKKSSLLEEHPTSPASPRSSIPATTSNFVKSFEQRKQIFIHEAVQNHFHPIDYIKGSQSAKNVVDSIPALE